MRIGLLGASFDTGNMGVNALAESAIKCILHRWPDAQITLLDSGRAVDEEQIRIGDKNLCIKKLPIRLCRNILLENHFVVLCFYALLFKVVRREKFKRFCTRRNASLKCIVEIDMVADITGGDSFSDIYGMRRFIIGFLRKRLVLLFNKDLIMLPQTYGPFKHGATRAMARHILSRASMVYSRDLAGIEYVNTLLNNRQNGKVRFAPDVAFVLDPRRPANQDIDSLEKIKTSNRILVGLNVSGLLGYGSDVGDNVFDLKINYPALIDSIVELLMRQEGTAVLLVPHVVPTCKPGASPPKSVHVHKKGYREQSDAVVCGALYERVVEKYPGRIFIVRGRYNHNETKYIIGLCDFFIGSRMHACIAALSQGIPAVGIAYSGKFHGVFESIGLSDCVVDTRSCDNREALEKLGMVFERRNQIRKHLEDAMPQVKNDVLSAFDITSPKKSESDHFEQ